MINRQISLKNRIVNYFEQRKNIWVNGGEIERNALETGYKASNASRRLRELANEGILERKLDDSGSVWYKIYNN